MMRWIWLCLLLAVLLSPARAREEVPELRVVTSETHALYYMLECLIDEPHRSPEMAQSFRGRVSNWTLVESVLRAWRSAREGPELTGLRLPRVQGRTPNVSTVLEIVSLRANDSGDFVQCVEPWLGPQHSHRLRAALVVLEPLFQQYYWIPAHDEFRLRRDELVQQLEQGGFPQALTLAMGFFDGRLPPGQQPTLALIPHLPVPGSRGVTRGHNSGTLQVLELLVEGPSRGQAGTVFHEFLHALWSGQSQAERNRWEQRFARHGAWGRAAYVQLNEGLATALGNGWFHARVHGHTPESSWYSDPVIDRYGHALLPAVQSAVEQGRPPSDDELDHMVRVFQQALPDALNTFDVVAADFLTVSSRKEVQEGPFQNEVMRLGPVRWSRTRQWQDLSSESSSTFRLYWLEPGQRNQLSAAGWSAEQCQGWQHYSLRSTDSGWELAFEGPQAELFQLLRRLQKQPLTPHQDGVTPGSGKHPDA